MYKLITYLLTYLLTYLDLGSWLPACSDPEFCSVGMGRGMEKSVVLHFGGSNPCVQRLACRAISAASAAVE